MENVKTGIAIIGAGACGLYLAIKVAEKGVTDLVVLEKEKDVGGILRVLDLVKIDVPDLGGLVSPKEFMSYLMEKTNELGIRVYTETTAIDLKMGFHVISVNPRSGVIDFEAEKVIIATGGREVNQYDLLITGTRPAGIFTALQALELMAEFKKKIGRTIVIYGRNDTALEVALKALELGSQIKAIITNKDEKVFNPELLEMLKEKNIELIENSEVIEVKGLKRLGSIVVKNIETKGTTDIECDTLVLSHGFLPDLTLFQRIGAKIDLATKSPFLNMNMETRVENLFACGYAAKPYDDLGKALRDISKMLPRL